MIIIICVVDTSAQLCQYRMDGTRNKISTICGIIIIFAAIPVISITSNLYITKEIQRVPPMVIGILRAMEVRADQASSAARILCSTMVERVWVLYSAMTIVFLFVRQILSVICTVSSY